MFYNRKMHARIAAAQRWARLVKRKLSATLCVVLVAWARRTATIMLVYCSTTTVVVCFAHMLSSKRDNVSQQVSMKVGRLRERYVYQGGEGERGGMIPC